MFLDIRPIEPDQVLIMPQELPRLDPAQHPWMLAPQLRLLLGAIKHAGGEARFVGGCVRDALANRPVGDIDLACNLPPPAVATRLQEVGFRVVPTGIEHGTVTAVIDRKGYEITTLRRDVETDGRRALVEFTDNWKADAARRDFTFNALYVDEEGILYDYFDGRADLKAGRVRFIGNARDRIREDHLRILRFFRFFAVFGAGQPDSEALAGAEALKETLPLLSIERVWRELAKLLGSPKPLSALRVMQQSGILPLVLPEARALDRLERLETVEAKYGRPPNHLLRLASLVAANPDTAAAMAQRLKLSNRDTEELKKRMLLPAELKGRFDPVPFRRALYDYGRSPVVDAALLCAADEPSIDLEPALAAASLWERPSFPLQGSDLLKLNVPEGPRIGAILTAVENWWAADDFKPTRQECLERARREAEL